MFRKNQSDIEQKVKAQVIFKFLNEFNIVEKDIRTLFEKSLDSISGDVREALQFFYGGKIGSTTDVGSEILKIKELRFDKSNKFKDYTTTQILRLNEQYHFINEFMFDVVSLQRPLYKYDFQSSMRKIINMRNILAHEIIVCNFKERDIVDILSKENIEKNADGFLDSNDISQMDEDTVAIVSNYFYLCKMHNMLNGNNSSSETIV